MYLVTNRHVIYSHAASVISLNRRDGNPPDIIETDPTEWIVHPDGDDVAAISLSREGYFDRGVHIGIDLPYNSIIGKDFAKNFQIGVGDEVFMVGRFVNHQGQKENLGAARFGSVSMMPQPIWVAADHRFQESYAVEMRSRTGFSGSPVLLMRTAEISKQVARDLGCGLLGINWGYILDEDGENTWLNGVVPSWKVLELLEVPALKNKIAEAQEEIRKANEKGGAIQASSSPPANDANPNHRGDFTRLVNAAARKPVPKD